MVCSGAQAKLPAASAAPRPPAAAVLHLCEKEKIKGQQYFFTNFVSFVLYNIYYLTNKF
jgi:hypothetical protein